MTHETWKILDLAPESEDFSAWSIYRYRRIYVNPGTIWQRGVGRIAANAERLIDVAMTRSAATKQAGSGKHVWNSLLAAHQPNCGKRTTASYRKPSFIGVQICRLGQLVR